MKYVKILFAMALVLTMCSAFSLKKDHSKTVYAFGIAASFTDTVVYFTDIQILDSAKVSKEGFLTHRDLYSYQLKNYVEDNGLQQNSTCMIYFSENRKKLEKEAKYQWELSEYLNRDICQPEGFDAYGYPSELFKLDMERLGIISKRKPAKIIDFTK